ncbi:MAG: hypothetical protein QOE97_3728 [Pseudonocardiales bacterium]|jgi:hypothetical protein|nr:hypothetical protein [Pseudonocardiales bacterium]
MRYLMFVKTDESMPAGPPPPALYQAIGELGEQQAKDGSMILTGGLHGSAEGALVNLADGRIDVIDGPFAESKELIGGFAMFDVRDKDEALEHARRFLQVHADHWPGCVATVEVRRVMEDNEFVMPS